VPGPVNDRHRAGRQVTKPATGIDGVDERGLREVVAPAIDVVQHAVVQHAEAQELLARRAAIVRSEEPREPLLVAHAGPVEEEVRTDAGRDAQARGVLEQLVAEAAPQTDDDVALHWSR
jgi:hypothetical protein